MSQHVLEAKINNETGGKKGKAHRAAGFIPSTISHKGETQNILVNTKEFKSLLSHGFKKSSLVEIKVEGASEPATSFIKQVHRDPVTHNFNSIEFYQVTFGEAIHAETEVKIVGNSKGVKMGGLLEVFLDKVKVECLPKDLPEEIVVDVSELDMNGHISVGDLALPEGVTVMNDSRVMVCICHPPKKDRRAAKEEAATATAAPEGEAKAE